MFVFWIRLNIPLFVSLVFVNELTQTGKKLGSLPGWCWRKICRKAFRRKGNFFLSFWFAGVRSWTSHRFGCHIFYLWLPIFFMIPLSLILTFEEQLYLQNLRLACYNRFGNSISQIFQHRRGSVHFSLSFNVSMKKVDSVYIVHN